MHEIITVQLGQPSNYVATHFWNTQESYFTYSEDQESPVNHDIHWRAGLGADGSDTFTPRTVIYDLKGGFGSLRKINALYDVDDDSSAQGLWKGPTVIHKQQPIARGAYQESLDAGQQPPALTTSTVRYWSDFNRVFFHPRSIVQLNDFELNSNLMPFEKWSTGTELFSSLDKEHDLLDRDLRPFVEEADQMQGIQLLATFDDAWGGFASEYIERLRDEYGKTIIWAWGLEDASIGIPRDKRLIRLSNKAKTLTDVYKHASLVVPFTLPRPLGSHISLDVSSSWHTSAILASAMESVTLPDRLKDAANGDTLGGITNMLNAMGKQTVANLQMTVHSRNNEADIDSRLRQSSNSDNDDSEGVYLDLDFSPLYQLESLQRQNGFVRPRIFSQAIMSRSQQHDEIAGDLNPSEAAASQSRHRNPHQPIIRRYTTSLSFPLLDSFPKIFRDDSGDPITNRVALTTCLSTDTSMSRRLKMLRATVTRSIGLEDREALGNDLAEMADEYHEGWSSGSDEGDDD